MGLPNQHTTTVKADLKNWPLCEYPELKHLPKRSRNKRKILHSTLYQTTSHSWEEMQILLMECKARQVLWRPTSQTPNNQWQVLRCAQNKYESDCVTRAMRLWDKKKLILRRSLKTLTHHWAPEQSIHPQGSQIHIFSPDLVPELQAQTAASPSWMLPSNIPTPAPPQPSLLPTSSQSEIESFLLLPFLATTSVFPSHLMNHQVVSIHLQHASQISLTHASQISLTHSPEPPL